MPCSSSLSFISSSTPDFFGLLPCVRCYSLPSFSGFWQCSGRCSLLTFPFAITLRIFGSLVLSLFCAFGIFYKAFFIFLSCLAASSSSWASAILLRSPFGLPCLSLPSLLSWSSLILLFSTVSALLLCSLLFGVLVACNAMRLALIFFHRLSLLLLLSMFSRGHRFSPLRFASLLYYRSLAMFLTSPLLLRLVL